MPEPDPQQKPGPDGDNGDRRPNSPPPMKFKGGGMFVWILFGCLAILVYMTVANSLSEATPVSWGQMLNYVNSGKVKSIVVKDDRIVADLRKDVEGMTPPSQQVMVKISQSTKPLYVDQLNKIAPQLITEDPSSGIVGFLVNWGLMLLILGLVWFFIFRAARGAGGGMGMLGNFGRSRHKVVSKEMTHINLSDVAGIEEAKEEVGEIIEFLKHPKKFQRLGGRIPRGVLLIGEPGCGKTLLAKAVAGEAEVPFFSISGSDFVEMFVGVGASRVRDLFKQAKDNSPCIVFLDEIDAVGRRRGSGFSSGGHDEREQTLNAILVEMDGFETSDQVIVMAATNRSDVLDPALTRPGRFDRQIVVPLPDVKGRFDILKVHARKVKMSPAVDLEKLARGTPMFSGADLAAIINEAAIIATLENKDFVEELDLEEARDKVRFGRSNKSRRVDANERVGTAYHEAGHAVVQYLLPHADPLHKVTIIPRGRAMGATFALPEKDRYGYSRNFLLATMRVMCAGRIAEKRKTGDVTSGAQMDIQMATQQARHMVLVWGMSQRLGFVDYTPSDQRESLIEAKPYSDDTARIIDEEIKRLIDEAYADTQRMIDEHWDKVTKLAEALLKYETLNADDVDRIMQGKDLDKPTVSDLLQAEASRNEPKAVAPNRKPLPNDRSEPESGTMPSPA